MRKNTPLKIAVVGTGISGLSAAWLLGQHHDVTIYEQNARPGGHANTVSVNAASGCVGVDTGFIVFNRVTYPNLAAMFAHLNVPTDPSDMSFAASVDDGAYEYGVGTPLAFLAQPHILLQVRFWRMMADLRRFYRDAERDSGTEGFARLTLGEYLARAGYGTAFRNDHLLPMASAIWSCAPDAILEYPALAFVRFHANHGLLRMTGRPAWETVRGGSVNYVRRILGSFAHRIKLGVAAQRIDRAPDGVTVLESTGGKERFDHAVVATHADQALRLLSEPSREEKRLLGAFRYSRNMAVLHSDPQLMPKRRAVWASWNYVGSREGRASFTYWMNRLQRLPDKTPLFVTLNPLRPPKLGSCHHTECYDHPLFDAHALAAQRQLWSLQGVRRTWFCGAYFGAGFHEDGLQAGLAVAEDLGGMSRPWRVDNESGRIVRRALNPHAVPELVQ